MRDPLVLGMLILPMIAGSCAHRRTRVAYADDRHEVAADLALFTDAWLAPARLAPPTIDFEARTVTVGGITATVTPMRAEDAEWNTWADGSARLFNNRVAMLFAVRLEGTALRWRPEGTLLELNAEGNGLPAVGHADDLLVPLLRRALAQERFALDGDLADRTRAAGPFRAAYLPTDRADVLEGIIAFPMSDPDQQVVALRVRVAVEDEDGLHVASFLYD